MLSMQKISKYGQLCPVTFGNGAIQQIGEGVKNAGIKKVLVVTDPGIVAAGHTQTALDSLEAAGVATVVYDRAETDAPDYTIADAARIGKDAKVEAVVGVGGGSVLDTAKGVAAYIPIMDTYTITEYVRNSFAKFGEFKPALPTVMIPTTAGTGSEVTQIAVITDTKSHIKQGCLVFPNISIVDPALTVTADAITTAFTGMDAFSHANEALTSTGMNPHSDLLAMNAMERIITWLPIAVKEPENLEARTNLALASNFAGKAFADALVHVGHAMAHALGAMYHIPHGIGCALVTPVVMEHCADIRPGEFARIGRMLGAETDGLEGKTLALAVADGLRTFVRKIGIPSMKEQGFTRQQTIDAAKYVLNEGMRLGCYRQIPDTEIPQMMADVYDKYQ
jgi:alcohol dehydrogenase